MISTFSSLQGLLEQMPELFAQMQELIPKERKLAVAVSWGSDSMLLAFLVQTFRENQGRNQNFLFFLHCNHKVRRESDDEQAFLQDFFHQYNFVVFERVENISANEESLRSRRYEQFSRFMREHSIEVLLTGHNLTDRIEGTMLNMLRGCGIKGFVGMKRVEEHILLDGKQVLRPLLWLSKEKIQNLVEDFGIPYFHDKSNDDNSVSKRNLIRNQFLSPLAEHSFGDDGEKAFWHSRNLVYQHVEQQFLDKNLFLKPLKLNPYRWAIQGFEWCLPEGLELEKSLGGVASTLDINLSQGEYLELCRGFKESSDGYWSFGDWQIFVAHGKKYFIKGKKVFWEKELVLEKKVTEIWIQTFGLYQIEVWEGLLWAKIRFAKQGDKYQGKSLKKRMLNQKIPIFRRNALPLAEKEGKIILVWKPEMLIF